MGRRYSDPALARRLAVVLGAALIVGAALFFVSSCCWLAIFDSADERKKRKYRKAQQRKLVSTGGAGIGPDPRFFPLAAKKAPLV